MSVRLPIVVAAAGLAVLCLTESASAGALATPAVFSTAGQSIACVVQNIGTTARSVTSTLVDQSGGTIDEDSLTVEAGAVKTLSGVLDPSAGVYCRFTGLSRKVRGFVHLLGSSGTAQLLPATK